MRYDVAIIGGGLAGITAGIAILKAGHSCITVSEGLSLHKTPLMEYVHLGGIILNGDSVLGGEWEGGHLRYIRTRNLEGTVIEADHFILASGKFFSKGLVSTMDSIREPVFGADVKYDPDRNNWYSKDFFDAQPFESFGVVTDGHHRVKIGGSAADNLYAAGEILAGVNSIGASAEDNIRSTAYAAVNEIIEAYGRV